MVTLISDGGTMTVGRRTASFTWGSFDVVLPEGTEKEQDDGRIVDGYIYRPDDRGKGRGELTFVRADARVDMNAERSDLEDTLDGASRRTEGAVFYTREVSGLGLGKKIPGVDYGIGDVVDVLVWGKRIALPVTGLRRLTSTDRGRYDAVQVGGQALSDPERQRKLNSDLDRQIAAEKRQRLKEAGEIRETASEAKSTADTAKSTAEQARGMADTAQQSADGKSTVFYGAIEPTSAKEGDTWFKETPDGIVIMQFENGAWVQRVDVAQMESDLADNENALAVLNTETLPDLDSKLGKLNNETLPGLAGDLEALEEELNTVRTTEVPNKLAALRADLVALDKELGETLAEELSTVKTALEAADRQLEGELNTALTTEIPAKLAALRADLVALDKELGETLAEELSTVKTALEAADRQLEGALSGLSSELEKLPTVADVDGVRQIADGKNSIYTSTSAVAASTPGKAGDLWLRVDSKANVIGMWTHSGTAWVSRDVDNLAEGSVKTGQLAANAVVAGKIATGAVTAGKILASAVTTDKLAADAVVADKIAANAVTAGKVAANAISAGAIAAGAVIADKLAANAVVAGKIAANAVTAGKIAADAVTANEIKAGAVTATELAANAVVAGKIAANAVIAGKVAANAISAGNIIAGAVIADKLATNAVTSQKISANAVTAGKIAANAVTAREILAESIVSEKIAADAVTASKLTIAPGNIFPDPDFKDPAWPTSQSGNHYVQNNALILKAGGWQTGGYYQPSGMTDASMQWEPGGTYRLTAHMRFGGSSGVTYVSVYARYTNTAGTLSIRKVGQLDRFPAGGTHASYQYADISTDISELTGAAEGTKFTLGFFVEKGHPNGSVHISNVRMYKRVGSTLIEDGAITTDKIQANAVTANEIKAGAVTATELASNAVTANKVAANAITAGKIATNAVTTNKIAAKAVTSDKMTISNGFITNAMIANATIQHGKIASLDASKITTGELRAERITAGTITAREIRADAVSQNTYSLIPTDAGTGVQSWTNWASSGPHKTTHSGGDTGWDGTYWRFNTTREPSSTMRHMVVADSSIEYEFSVWLHGTAGSVLYIELRDQDGNLAVETSPVGRNRGSYLVDNHLLTSSWTHHRAKFRLKPGVRSVMIGKIYGAHPNGVTPAVANIGGMEIKPFVLEQREIDARQDQMDEALIAMNDATSAAIQSMYFELLKVKESTWHVLEGNSDDYISLNASNKNITALGTWVGKIHVANSNGWRVFNVGANRTFTDISSSATVYLIQYQISGGSAVNKTISRGSGTLSTSWASLWSTTKGAAGTITGSVSIHLSNAHRGSTYGLGIRVNGSLRSPTQVNSNIGPITPLGSGRWTHTLNFNMNVPAGATIEVVGYCSNSGTSQRSYSKVTGKYVEVIF